MKKFLSMIAAVVAVFTFAACGGDETAEVKLTAPAIKSVVATEAGDGFTVTWNAVKGASEYVVMLKGSTKTYTTKETSYTFEGLTYGTYTPMVKAVSASSESDYAVGKSVTIEGVASVDWFSLSLELPENNAENAAKGVNSSNSIIATMSGEGITDVYCGWFRTSSLEGASRDDIVNELEAFEAKDAASYIAGINSAEGLSLIFPMFYGSESFTFYILAYQDEAQILLHETITTDPYMPTTATESWLGTWSAYTEKTIYFGEKDDEVDLQINDKLTEFNLKVTPHETYSDMVYVDGLTCLGEGLPVVGYTGYDENGAHVLYIYNVQQLTNVNADGYAIYLLTYAEIGGELQFTAQDVPSVICTYTSADDFKCELFYGEYQDGTKFDVKGLDIIHWNTESGALGFVMTEDEFVYDTFKYGPITLEEKTAEYQPEAQAMSANARPSFAKMPTSMVVAF